MTTNVTITGLEELKAKFAKFPQVFQAALMTTMEAVLYKVWEHVPPYPPPPPNSTYRRTGLLGRSIGVSEGGHKLGKPGIFEIRKRGGAVMSASFGTRLGYAPDVIGESQKAQFTGRWWTLGGVARMAEAEVIKLFELMARKLAAWLSDEGPPPA